MNFACWIENADKASGIIDGNDFIFLFKKGDSYYGAGEDSRIVFARMKNPDKDLPPNWKKEASFVATDLKKALEGLKSQNIFYAKDLKDIKVMDREEVIKELAKYKAKDNKFNNIAPGEIKLNDV